MQDLFKKLQKAILNKDEFSTIMISTLIKNLGIPVERFGYDEESLVFIVSVKEVTCYYNCDDDVTYSIEVDSDGNNNVVWIENGLVY